MDITQGGTLNATDLNEIIDLTAVQNYDLKRTIEPQNARHRSRNRKTVDKA